MKAGTRQIVMLAVLAGVLAVVVATRFDGDTPAGTAAAPSNRAAGAPGGAPGEVDETDVKLELLQGDRDSLTDAARNPFRFEAREPAPPPPPPREEPSEVFGRPPAMPPGPPPPPPIPLRFIGYVSSQNGVQTASFSDGRGNVFQGREGDIIEGRYKVLRIASDSVELAYLDGRGRQTIRLSGQ